MQANQASHPNFSLIQFHYRSSNKKKKKVILFVPYIFLIINFTFLARLNHQPPLAIEEEK